MDASNGTGTRKDQGIHRKDRGRHQNRMGFLSGRAIRFIGVALAAALIVSQPSTAALVGASQPGAAFSRRAESFDRIDNRVPAIDSSARSGDIGDSDPFRAMYDSDIIVQDQMAAELVEIDAEVDRYFPDENVKRASTEGAAKLTDSAVLARPIRVASKIQIRGISKIGTEYLPLADWIKWVMETAPRGKLLLLPRRRLPEPPRWNT